MDNVCQRFLGTLELLRFLASVLVSRIEYLHCPPSIRKFEVTLGEPIEDDKYDKIILELKDDDDITRWKQGDVAGNASWMVATDDILAIFARCPNINIKKLIICFLSSASDYNAIGNFIGKERRQLRALHCDD
ncbi:hypothetical protein BGZ95_004393 [Linnemannia exigua]|uniref:Uncharacterized protein n=1 Tax=Linnemannia exigua TaxID=604196 RepID=A0AAD4D3J6_9FUNG|nr:hypothetical protein BGZ95_004393 [Linnemannia exigua]